jgi:hypothetical protein
MAALEQADNLRVQKIVGLLPNPVVVHTDYFIT